MNPGRELDALVAEKIMRIDRAQIDDWLEDGRHPSILVSRFDRLPHYSTDIAAAWKVFEKIRDRRAKIRRCLDPDSYVVEFGGFEATANTAPHAICLAAIKVMDTEV